MLFLILILIITNAEKPFSISYTKENCKSVTFTGYPRCYCISECRNYTYQYPSVLVYKINTNCNFLLWENGGYECLCIESNKIVKCLNMHYQFFE